MTHEEAEAHAQSYVDRVLESQKALGHESKLSDEEYRQTIDRTAQAFAGLVEPEPTPDESVPA
jgi:hypothetical protein